MNDSWCSVFLAPRLSVTVVNEILTNTIHWKGKHRFEGNFVRSQNNPKLYDFAHFNLDDGFYDSWCSVF